MGLFGGKQNETQTIPPSADEVEEAKVQAVANDLILGMLETGRRELELHREQRMPYFGFLLGRPIDVDFTALVNKMAELTESIEPNPQPEEREGSFLVMLGPQQEGMGFRFNVHIGPQNDWLRLIIIL